jgi:hypothetical protein
MRLERWRYSVPLRVRGLFRRGRLETDLTDEFRDHLERDRAVCNRRRGGAVVPSARAILKRFACESSTTVRSRSGTPRRRRRWRSSTGPLPDGTSTEY